MQIALVAVVLLAGMWFTVLKPKPADDSVTPAAATPAASSSSEPVAPGVKGLATAVEKAKGASATSDATNAKIQSATGGNATAPAGTPAATPSKAKAATTAATKAKAKTTAAKAKAKATAPGTGAAAVKPGTKAATAKATTNSTAAKAKAATPATDVDPSNRLLAFLAKGKTLVVLFEGKGVDDQAARRAVHRAAKADPKHVVSAYIPITDVGKYEAITSDVQIMAAPSILIIGTDRKATLLSGYVDVQSVRQAVGDARRDAAAAKKAK
jgi:hypothetical protein